MRLHLARILDTLGAWMQQAADKVDPPKACECEQARGFFVTGQPVPASVVKAWDAGIARLN